MANVRSVGIRVLNNVTIDDKKNHYNNSSSLPSNGIEGQVLMMGSDGSPKWADMTDIGYVHPSTHPASMITEDDTRMFVTKEEKLAWSKTNVIDLISITEIGNLF